MGSTRFDFSGQNVVVTGGSSGIGREIALTFGRSGATVINADVRPDPKDLDADVPTHERINKSGGDSEYRETDVSDPEQLDALIKQAHMRGGVDVLVNCAAIHRSAPFEKITPEQFSRVYDVNVAGTFFAMQAAVGDMIERGVSGTIVNIASISSSEVQEDNLMYEASKAAVKMITRSASFALAEHGIRVNAVAPGHTATEFVEGLTEYQQEKAKNDDGIKPIPLSRAALPEDIAPAVLFLASDESEYITGELLHVDGGWQVL